MAAAFQVTAYGVLLAQPSTPDSGDGPAFAERVQLELYRGDVAAGTTEVFASGSLDPVVTILLVGGGVTALLALLAGLMVTALALADGKADHATLAAVGAPPGTRRWLGAATAGYVAVLGCVVGSVSGLLGSFVLVPLVNHGYGGTWVMPWAMLGVVLVGVPLLTSAAAWLTTRSTVPLTRRTDT
jgi:putative ABC transport system permease protein